MNNKTKNKIPIKKEGDGRNKFLFREEGEKLLIQGTHVIYILEDLERFIYNLIDGKRNIEEIVKELTIRYGVAYEKIYYDVESFLNQLVEKGLIFLKG